jgi:hypothetical protein
VTPGAALCTVTAVTRLSVAVLLLGVAGCGPSPLRQTQASADALARAVLEAVALRDEVRLRALAIVEREFEQRVWPALPAARPERNLPWSYVWMDLQQKSDLRLRRMLQEHGGRRYELQHVRFDGSRTTHGTYVVHRDAVFVVRDAAGRTADLRLIGAMLEADEGWKVFSYNVDQ